LHLRPQRGLGPWEQRIEHVSEREGLGSDHPKHDVRSGQERKESRGAPRSTVSRDGDGETGRPGGAPYDGARMLERDDGSAGGPGATGPRLAGLRCIVTGAARGIGAEIARRFAAEGAMLGLLDVASDVKAVAADLDAVAQIADLVDPGATREAMVDLVAALGGVDVLINNAGILRLTPLLDVTVDEWDLVMAVNTRAMLVTTQIAARSMIDAGHGGRIVNMASMAAKQAAADQAHYAASKAAVVALTQAAAVELGPHRITVNAICPGYVLTEMGAATRTPEMVSAWSASSPLGRCAEPADVARMASFLASGDADYCTGQAFNVTGGMIMH
jgi:NAD(P)-dependent dehydrogenase (short-subunit alcohol dehydrogenase family)